MTKIQNLDCDRISSRLFHVVNIGCKNSYFENFTARAVERERETLTLPGPSGSKFRQISCIVRDT
jgi:hypothetical protein